MRRNTLACLLSLFLINFTVVDVFAKGGGSAVQPCTGKGMRRCHGAGRPASPGNQFSYAGLSGIYDTNCKSINGNFVSPIVRIIANSAGLTIDIPSEMNLTSPALATIEFYSVGSTIDYNLGDGYRKFVAEFSGATEFQVNEFMASSNEKTPVFVGRQIIRKNVKDIEIVESDANGSVTNSCTLNQKY